MRTNYKSAWQRLKENECLQNSKIGKIRDILQESQIEPVITDLGGHLGYNHWLRYIQVEPGDTEAH